MKNSKDNLLQFKTRKYTMTFIFRHFLAILMFFPVFMLESCQAQQVDAKQQDTKLRILPGVYQMNEYLPLCAGKNVGVVCNQSSVINNTHLIDTLMSLNMKVSKIFTPEHGYRGTVSAGVKIENSKESKTNIEIISLYGNHKKPNSTDLSNLDVMIFDLQDVGVRFYTYISTLHYVMEAAAENDVELIILDRPNPNVHIVDGPVLEPEFKSFIGMHPVPVLYGMTIGEYAEMINGEQWLENGVKCKLRVVKIQNYNHQSKYALNIHPSPNLRSDNAIQLYPSLCFFEGTIVSVGRGTDLPFEVYGNPKFPDSYDFSFVPTSQTGAVKPKLEGRICYAVNLSDSTHYFNQLKLDYLFHARDILYPMYGDNWINRPSFFNLLAGNNQLVEQLNNYVSEDKIRSSWKQGLEQFKLIRKKYLLYSED